MGEYLARKDEARAVKVGLATWVGIMLGLLAKVVLAFIMVGVFRRFAVLTPPMTTLEQLTGWIPGQWEKVIVTALLVGLSLLASHL